tara:strand:+ start:322 stop:972 length:651 start_codon:yes stop_codon:yes gene_type:complete
MEIIRVIKNRNYSVIANEIFRDKNISLKAKGLLGILLSLPHDWNLSIEGLTKITKEGRHSITSTIGELIKHGYIERNKIRQKGKFDGYQYIVMEKPKSGNPKTAKPLTENPIQLSKDNNKITNNKDNMIEKLISEVKNFDTTETNKTEFLEYWMEKSRSGKTRYEMQKTWCTKRRMKTWIKNQNNWYRKNNKDKVETQMTNWLSAREIIKRNNENN